MHPVVLHHGLMSFGTVRFGKLSLSSFSGIRKAIVQRGHPLMLESVHPTASIERRARMLKRMIIERFGEKGTKIIIIAHSMGGLDARYMITHLGMAQRVGALVTVCTPHHGSPMADHWMRNIGQMGALQLARTLHLDIGAVSDLTCESCTAFNGSTPDVPGVRYYSVSAARPRFQLSPIYFRSHKIIFDAEGDNDGLVSVASSKWGEHLGVWPVDHVHAVNRRLVIDGFSAGSDVTPRYMQLLDRVTADLAGP